MKLVYLYGRLLSSFVAILCLSLYGAAYAAVSGDLVDVLEGNLPSDGVRVKITDGTFHRQTYNAMGGRVVLAAYEWDESIGAYVWAIQPGDTLKFIWRDSESGEVVGEKATTYLGGENSCWSTGHCGQLTNWTSLFEVQCMLETSNIEVETYFNNVMFGAASAKPERFHPAVSIEAFPNNIRPKRYKGLEGETGDISLLVVDDLECGAKISDAVVRLEAKIVPGTNGHGYDMGEKGIGTGKFVPVGYEAVVNPDEDEDVKDTVVEGVSDENGIFKVQYQAQDHALLEQLTITVKRPENGVDPEIIAKEKSVQNLKISVPGLSLLTASSGYFSFRDFGSCVHSEPVNYVTSAYRSKLIALSAVYYAKTGMRLSLNDASLPWGGFIANFKGTKKEDGESVTYDGGRDAPCHKSHRFGIDVDLNKDEWITAADRGRDINVEEVEEGDRSVTAITYLTSLMKRYGACRVIEEPIHYRYVGGSATCK